MADRGALRDRYRQLNQRVAEAADRVGRNPAEILTVAVTKYATPDRIRQLIELGHRDLGENRVQQLSQRVAMTQEFLDRHHRLEGSRHTDVPEMIRWHMIGHLQRNKVRPVISQVKLIHSVDSLRLAEEIQTQGEREQREVDILLQINASGEKAKYGIAPPAAIHIAEQFATMFNIRLRGLMCMAPFSENPEDSRYSFERTTELFYEMKKRSFITDDFNVLSMGMSNDFEVAIECGANVIRIGRMLFGEEDA